MFDSELQSRKTQELIIILQELEEPGLSDFDLKLRGNRMKDIYLSESGEVYRHSYSEITDYMYSHHVCGGVPTIDPGSTILENLHSIQEDWETDKECNEKEKYCRALQKLIDHVNLEVVRLGQMADIYYKLTMKDTINQKIQENMKGMQEIAFKLEKQQKVVEEVEQDIENRRKEIEDIQGDVRNHNIQAITVLSIFSCVVFSFTGGFSLISGALNILPNIPQIRTPLLVGVILLISIVLIDAIYMLLRAARHYTHDYQGHLVGFVVFNILGILIAFGLLTKYYFG